MQGVCVCVVLPSSQHQPGGDSTALHRDSVLAGLKPAPTLSVCSEVGLVRKGSCWGARKGFSPAGQGQTSLLRGEEHTKGSAALRYMGRGGEERQKTSFPPPPQQLGETEARATQAQSQSTYGRAGNKPQLSAIHASHQPLLTSTRQDLELMAVMGSSLELQTQGRALPGNEEPSPL